MPKWYFCPMFVLAVCFGAGIAFMGIAPAALGWTFFSLGVLAAGAVAVFEGSKKGICYGLALVAGMAAFLIADAPKARPVESERFRGRVRESSLLEGGDTAYILDELSVLENGVWTDLRGRARLVSSGKGPRADAGLIIEVPARLSIPKGKRNPGGFDYAGYLKTQGVLYIAAADDVQSVGVDPRMGLSRLIQRMRDRVNLILDACYGPNAPLVRALTLGDKGQLPDQTYMDFQKAGVLHLLAVSGLHVTILLIAFDALLSLFCLPARLRTGLFGVFLLFYLLLTGFAASIVRAAIMAMLVLIGKRLGRTIYLPATMGCALILTLLVNPLFLFTTGFQLSFASVLAIFLFTPATRRLFTWCPKKLGEALAMSLAVQIGFLPFVLLSFGSLSLYVLPANLLMIPLSNILLVLALLTVALGLIAPPLSTLIVFVTDIGLEVWKIIAGFFARLPYSDLAVPMPHGLVGVGVLCALIVCSPFFIGKKRQRLLRLIPCGALIILGLIVLPAARTGVTEVCALDVGQGDCLYLRTPDGRDYLIDCGGRLLGYDAGRDVVVPFLLSQGVSRLHGIFLSHPDTDHIGGLDGILSKIRTDAVYCVRADGFPENLSQRCDLIELGMGEVLELGAQTTAEVIWPSDDFGSADRNELSMVLLVRSQGVAMLFSGDAGAQAEKGMDIPDVDLLKVAHHGAESSTGAALLLEATPRVALISVGANKYGHPAARTLDRLGAVGAEVYRTDERGAIFVRFRSGRGSLSIATMIR